MEGNKGEKNYTTAIIVIFIIAVAYTILPDLMPGPVDDAVVDGVSGIIIIILKILEARTKNMARDFVVNNRNDFKATVKSKMSTDKAKQHFDECADFVDKVYDEKSAENLSNVQRDLNAMKASYGHNVGSTEIDTLHTDDMNLF